MEFVALLFTIIFGSIAGGAAHSATSCRNDIIDIYYPADREYSAYDDDCRFTKTLISCADCASLYVSRNNYDKFAKSYTMHGMKPPVPRRTDTDEVFEPTSVPLVKFSSL